MKTARAVEESYVVNQTCPGKVIQMNLCMHGWDCKRQRAARVFPLKDFFKVACTIRRSYVNDQKEHADQFHLKLLYLPSPPIVIGSYRDLANSII
jgi:hypothetical protein